MRIGIVRNSSAPGEPEATTPTAADLLPPALLPALLPCQITRDEGKSGGARRVGDQVNVVAISGSLQRESANTALLRAVALASTRVDVSLWDELGELPHFRPDIEGDEHVASLRGTIADADALLIATPEYAGGMPGALKNALDWLVGSGELYGKPVVVISAAPSVERGQNARRWVADVVEMQGGAVLDSFTVAIGRSDGAAQIADKADVVLRRTLGAFDRRLLEDSSTTCGE